MLRIIVLKSFVSIQNRVALVLEIVAKRRDKKTGKRKKKVKDPEKSYFLGIVGALLGVHAEIEITGMVQRELCMILSS